MSERFSSFGQPATCFRLCPSIGVQLFHAETRSNRWPVTIGVASRDCRALHQMVQGGGAVLTP